MALFEVAKDMNDPKQFILVRRDANIHEKVQSWKSGQQKYVKLVIPIYDPKSVSDASNSKSTSKLVSTFKPLQSATNTKTAANEERTVSEMQNEISKLSNNLTKTTEQLDTLR